YSVNVSSVNNSTGPVSLSCSVQPATATCKMDPASVTLTGLNTQSAVVSFSVAQQAHAAASRWKQISLALAMLLPFGFFGRRNRRWRALISCLIFLLLLPIGCGVASSAGSSSGGGGGTSPPPPSATYTLTVTGSMPGVNKTITTQVTVE